MSKRPDQLKLSLGKADYERRKAALNSLAKAMEAKGQYHKDTVSVSALICEIADIAEYALPELVAALKIARGCASGEDWYELVEIIEP